VSTVGYVAAIVIGALMLVGLISAVIVYGRSTLPGNRTMVPFSPTDLMSDFEVSQAIGVHVAAGGVNDVPTGWARIEMYQAVNGGTRLMQATVLTGRAGRVAMRGRRRGARPMARVGEEAYAGDGWAIGRHGAVVVLLQQLNPDRWAAVGAMPWLLDTALGRVPSRDADTYR
jgi:hypothetical protein